MPIEQNQFTPGNSPATEATKRAALKEVENFLKMKKGSHGSHPYECLYNFSYAVNAHEYKNEPVPELFDYAGDFVYAKLFVDEMINFFLNADHLTGFESKQGYKDTISQYLPAIRTLFDDLGRAQTEAKLTKYYLEHFSGNMLESEASKLLVDYKRKNGNS